MVNPQPEIAVIVPVYNEAENVALLAEEIDAALTGRSFEMIFVDDASSDDTAQVLTGLKTKYPELRVISHRANAGQSRAVRSGVMAAKAPIIATLDGDGQNDPADIPALYMQLIREDAPAKVFSREAFLRLPFFDHIHRYIPALMIREGYAIEFADVNHRPRAHGVSKYTNFGRLMVSIADLRGVMWLNRRARNPDGWDEL